MSALPSSSTLMLAAVAGLTAFAPVARAAPGDQGVMGGGPVAEGSWRDVAAVNFSGTAECSGVLIAPTVALTAGHCDAGNLDSILVGTNSLARPELGELIPVARHVEYPDSFNNFDLTVLVLARPATVPPRAIATGWASLEIIAGAAVQIVGYGALDRDASQYVDELHEAETTITSGDCAEDGLGCNLPARPAGELGAGGMGIDTCPGDSGGPLYLKTSYGDFVAGITSRAYEDAVYPCQDGGIYTRPDAVIDWIEQTAGVPVSHAPEPTADALALVPGGGGQTVVVANDPRATAHTFALAGPPEHGQAAVAADGRVRYCAAAGYTGDDWIPVTVTDASNPARTLTTRVYVQVQDGLTETGCSLEFDDDGAGGCCAAGPGHAGGRALVAGLVGLLLLRRRRAAPRAR